MMPQAITLELLIGLLELLIMLLQSSITPLDNVNSAGITHDHHTILRVQVNG
jgi:hypothetical protein